MKSDFFILRRREYSAKTVVFKKHNKLFFAGCETFNPTKAIARLRRRH